MTSPLVHLGDIVIDFDMGDTVQAVQIEGIVAFVMHQKNQTYHEI
jgi:hypothetical protein